MALSGKLLIGIPAYNERDNLPNLVQSLKKLQSALSSRYPSLIVDYLVVNDGSSDDSAKWLSSQRVPHLDLTLNLGIGGAVQSAYLYAANNNYDWCLQLDGDGQHPPAEVLKLLQCLERTKAQCIIGSRFLEQTQGNQSTKMRRLGIRIISGTLKLLFRARVHDPTSGFRLVDKNLIHLFKDDYPYDYPEPETLAFCFSRGFSVAEVAVNMSNRQSGVSSIRPLHSGYYMFKVISAIILQKLS